VVIVDDPGVVGVRADIRIELGDLLLERSDEVIDLLFRDEGIVRRHASLSAIGELAVGDAVGGGA
jgi:hypothetical protein